MKSIKGSALGFGLVVFMSVAAASCTGGGAGPAPGNPSNASSGSTGQPPAGNPSRSYQTTALLFTGNGTWSAEVDALKALLTANGATYQAVDSPTLDSMSVQQLTTFGVLIFPGGSGGTEAGSLSAQTHANLRAAVQEYGVSYIGFCAGAFIGEAPAPSPGGDVSYGLGIVNGPVLNDYVLASQNVDYQMTLDKFPDGSTKDLLWYGGPVTPNQGVIAKYPTGDPAISEMWSGKGFVVLSGPHPAATQAILDGLGLSSTDGLHTDFAWQLIAAAITQQPLPTF
jgi:glutamine amidotransferase-like uncharacterized protein